tara:strand:- start:20 stop:517 length:498 start_codon:yes stop_codon:yes gene_type:complete
MNSKIKYIIYFLCGVLIVHFLVNSNVEGFPAESDFTCNHGTAVSGTTSDSNTENCTSCNVGFIKVENSCVPITKCANFDKSGCDHEDDYNISGNCSGETCTKEECCKSGISPIIIGFICLCVCCLLLVGIVIFINSDSIGLRDLLLSKEQLADIQRREILNTLKK